MERLKWKMKTKSSKPAGLSAAYRQSMTTHEISHENTLQLLKKHAGYFEFLLSEID